jgi:fibronectin type 3 domain-containing protein
MPRENFYILLELSPTETDTSRIDAAIKKKQSEWSKMRNHPTKGGKAQKYLGLIPEIKKVMGDNALCQAEAKDAKILQDKAEKEKFKELDEYIRILSLKGKMLEKDVRQLAKEFKGIPEVDIRSRIKVPIIKDEQPTPQNKKTPPLPKPTAKVISDALEIVGKRSLYDFLELSPTSSLKTLEKLTREKDIEIKQVAHKDAFITASGTLIGQCLTLFKTQKMREAYDATLAQKGLADLDKAIRIAGMSGQVHLQAYEELLKKAISFGLDKDEARQYILDYCKKKNWAVEMAAKSAALDMQQCGVCGVLNVANVRNCENCGYPLEIDCPQCSTRNSSTAQFCRQCGFAVGDMPNALSLLRRGKLALTEKDFNLASQLLQQAEIYWPRHPEITQALQSIQSEKQAIDDVVQKIHSLNNQRYFYQARQVLARLKQLDPSHPELSLGKRIEPKIAAAEIWLQKAKKTSGENARIDAYSAALAEAKDCREALDEMARLPPSPPLKLQVTSAHSSISLHWQSSLSKGDIVYRVIRQTDGKLIGETPQSQLEDTATEAGQEYYYAVYAVRGEASSHQAATAGPVMHLAEIKNLAVIPGDSCINLTWKTPTKTHSVEVWRKENGVVKKLTGVRLDGVTDTQLKNGTLYDYLIKLVFQDSKGKSHFSQGVTCKSRPLEPPQPIEDLSVSKQREHLEIKWTPPKKGSVQLFYSEQALPFSSGDSLPTNQLSELGTPITVQRIGNVRCPRNFQGVISIIPVTVEGELAIIGTAKVVTSINEVSNLRGQINYSKLYLEWDWPQNTRQVIVAYRHDNIYPSDPKDSLATLKPFTKQLYDKASAFVIHQPEKRDYYFTVFVAAGDKVVYSNGEHCLVANSGYQEIFYEIKIKKGLFGKIQSIQLILSTRSDSVTMPEAVLVTKVGNLPLRRADGSIIYSVPENTVIEKKPLVIELSQESQKKSYAKLFLSDKANEQKFRLVAAPKDKLKLN